MKRNIIRLTESELHQVIKESVKRILKEETDIQAIVQELQELEDKLIAKAGDIRRLYFENERYFDKFQRFERMGLDNPPYSHGSQGELSTSFDKIKWDEWTQGRANSFEQELHETYAYYKELASKCESEGYGIGAASRGFDVTRPIGILWSRSTDCLSILRKMSEITGVQV